MCSRPLQFLFKTSKAHGCCSPRPRQHSTSVMRRIHCHKQRPLQLPHYRPSEDAGNMLGRNVAPRLWWTGGMGVSRWLSTLQHSVNFLGRKLPSTVTVVEVGPRDGLQNEPEKIPTEIKVELIERLADAGVPVIETTSFVSPKWVPQLADAAEVLGRVRRRPGVRYPVLTPNLKGFENAIKAGAREVAIFTAASEVFNRKNLNSSVDESLRKFEDVTAAAKQEGVAVRGYVSCVVGCPYQGKVEPQAAAEVAGRLLEMGCYEVSMGDTIGVGTPATVAAMFEACKAVLPVEKLAAHMHDTYGQALANILAALQLGVSVVDSSIAGLGGCPYARGATGNVATEDVVYMLNGFGIQHGIDLDRLVDASAFITAALGRRPNSRVAEALLRRRESAAVEKGKKEGRGAVAQLA